MPEPETAPRFPAWRTRRARVLLVLGGVVAVAVLARAARARPVPAHAAARRPLAQRVVASGRVMAPARIELASLSLARVDEVAVREGEDVTKGRLLVRLDDAEARARLAEARARVEEAAARLDLVRGPAARSAAEAVRQAEIQVARAERELDRVRSLHAAGSASAAELDQAEEALSLARSRAETAVAQAASVSGEGADRRLAAATLRQARAAEEAARAKLEEREIRAPAAGKVLAREVEPGDVVQAGKVLLLLAADGPVRLTVQPDEKNLALLREGQAAEAVADAFPGEVFRAAVAWIAPAVDPARGTVEVRLDVPAPPQFLRPDMTVSVNVLVGEKEEALVLPSEAVRDAATAPWVLRISDGRAERREVRIGLRGEGAIEVLDGLAPGDLVVDPSAGAVAAGERVRPRVVEPGATGRAL